MTRDEPRYAMALTLEQLTLFAAGFGAWLAEHTISLGVNDDYEDAARLSETAERMLRRVGPDGRKELIEMLKAVGRQVEAE